MLVYLLRHLPTEYNRSGRYMGRSNDLPILDESVSKYRDALAKMGLIDNISRLKIICSSSLRCKQTANLLSELLSNTDVIINHDLDEVDYGDFEGKFPQDIKKLYPAEYRRWMERPSTLKFPGGESFVEVQQRAVKLVLEQIELRDGDNIFLVSHVDVIKMVICWVMDIPIDNKRMFRIDNGSVSCLETSNELYNQKKLRVRYLNGI
ncbi:MAG: histidine phosphatase family protein [bacterium]|nr:histidine phosphatase family protein [bacterium]